MLAVLEMIDEENKRIYRNGKKEGERVGRIEGEKIAKREKLEIAKREKLEIAKKLLKAKIPTKIIIDATGLTESELEKLKK